MFGFRHLRVHRKITSVFAILVGLVALSGLASYKLSADLAVASRSQSEAGALVISAKDALSAAIDLSAHLRGLVMTRIPGNASDIIKDQERFEANVAEARRGAHLDAALSTEIDGLVAAEGAWRREIVDRVVPLVADSATMDQASAMMTTDTNRKMVGAIRAAAGRVQATAQSAAASAAEHHAQALATLRTSSVLSTLVVAAAAAALSLLFARSIGTPIEAMTASMKRIAAGDLDVPLSASGRRDEIGAMQASLVVLRAAAVEKRRLEAEAEASGRLTEAERARNAAVLAEAAESQGRVVSALAAALSRLAEGDLAQRLDGGFTRDYEVLRRDFNDAAARLATTLRDVAATASTISTGTTEIATAADDLSRRTEQQAASLEETAASLNEITTTVHKTADAVHHARDVVGRARSGAERSGLVVRQAVEAVGDIARASREIGQIIGVIDEIAFQTNLLALNAGVEAARAGESGRGFAVVASEVRGLAQRSAEAARDIKRLIESSNAQVDRGVEYVGQTGEELSRIIAGVAEIDTIMGEIAAAAREEAVSLDEINRAVAEMDRVTQQNAAMVEQTTAASHALGQTSRDLMTRIGGFRLGPNEASRTRRAA